MILLFLSLFISSVSASSTFPCETTYDQVNIPHVTTSSEEGYYYCFGLNHGRDRAWEMDFFRRVAAGRNAEVLGFSQLKSDLMMRLLDLPSLAEKLWSGFPEDKKKIIQIYADGVNEGFKTGKNATEFKDIGFEPEPWLPQHTIYVLLIQSFDQTKKTFFRDYEEEKLKSAWGVKAESLFDQENFPWDNTILKEGEYKKSNKVVLQTSDMKVSHAKLWGEFPTLFGLESGSNNWVVSDKKSKTGNAILANDPHLDLKTPLFWYWIGLRAPGITMLGASVPGVPVIISGTNGKVAWGLTNSYLKSADAVFIKDLKKNQIESFRPFVKVKFGFLKIPFFFKSFEKLTSGHKVLPLELESDEKLILRWSGYSLTPGEVYPMFDFPKVQDVAGLNELTSKVGLPSWNYVFADVKGDIGYRVVGKTYKNSQKKSFGISRMSFNEFLSEEFLSPEERPHVLKPSRNYIYTANNRHWPTDGQFYGGRGYSHSYRGFRIDELLQKSLQDIESFKNIQCDNQVIDARFFVEKISKYISIPEFKNWDFSFDESSRVLPIYRRFMDLIKEKWNVDEYALYRLLENLDAEKIEELSPIYKLALADVAGRSWGEFHRINFAHLSKNTEWIFSPDISGVGDTHTVNPGTANWNAEKKVYQQFSGSSMRMIIELGKTPRVLLSLPGLNREYDLPSKFSPWDSWRTCQYSEIKF